MQLKAALALLTAFFLSGCMTTFGPASVENGECKIFKAPSYAVRGATQFDQDWIDPTIEGGVGGCKWSRPAPRPVELDALKPAPSPKIIKRRNLIKRIQVRVWPKAAVEPVTNVPSAPVVERPIYEPARRSALDELLHPDAK